VRLASWRTAAAAETVPLVLRLTWALSSAVTGTTMGPTGSPKLAMRTARVV
jgi:hypothetical protein